MSLLYPPGAPSPTPLSPCRAHQPGPLPSTFNCRLVDFFALGCKRAKPIPFPFNHFPTLCKKTRVSHERFFQLLSTRNSFRSNTYRRSPRRVSGFVPANPDSPIDRNQPNLSSRNPFRINTYKIHVCNPFRRNTYKTPGWG